MVKIQTLFGKRLKAARIGLGLTQRKLGLAAGMDIENAGVKINHYENRTHIPRLEVATKIAKALNVPTSYLYEQDDKMAKHILNLGKINQQKRKIIFAQAEKFANQINS